MTPLDDDAIAHALTTLTGWRRTGDALAITWRFPSFSAAIGWMSACVPAIDGMGHHPEWQNVYDRVAVRLTTHDAGNRITGADIDLATLLHQRALAAGVTVV